MRKRITSTWLNWKANEFMHLFFYFFINHWRANMAEEPKGKLFFIGMGLEDLSCLTLKGLQLLKESDLILLDAYTNYFDVTIPPELADLNIKLVSRQELEDNAREILDQAKTKKIALLVPGDPFLATTHVSLRMEAVQKGIAHEVVHNASIFSAAPSITGLSAYRFGKTATIPFPENKSRYPYDVCVQNLRADAHTLFLLDIDVKNDRFLDVVEGLKQLMQIENSLQQGVVTSTAIFIALCRVGSPHAEVKVGTITEFLQQEKYWKEMGPPQALVRCANNLHFAEKDALRILWGVNQDSSSEA